MTIIHVSKQYYDVFPSIGHIICLPSDTVCLFLTKNIIGTKNQYTMQKKESQSIVTVNFDDEKL